MHTLLRMYVHLSLQAIDCYTKSISLHSKNESPWVNRAICRSIQGHYQDALEDLTRACECESYMHNMYVPLRVVLYVSISTSLQLRSTAMPLTSTSTEEIFSELWVTTVRPRKTTLKVFALHSCGCSCKYV